jgi:cytochrome oxidase assembly protein ShyY1
MSRYRWALRPGWIASHLFVLACIVTFINLGFWQLRRLDERKAHNALIQSRETMVPVAIESLLGPGATQSQIDDNEFREVTVTGTYLPDDQVLIRNQTQDGAPGYYVATPIELANGDAVVVNRGWIPIQTGDDLAAAKRSPADDGFAPPSGRVTVTGLVAETDVQQGLAASDPPGTDKLPAMARIDVPRIQQGLGDQRLLPVYVNLQTQAPAQGVLPQALPAPVLDEGPHLNYAGQWFIFATLTCIVYPLLLRRTARNKEQEARELEWLQTHGDDALVGVGSAASTGPTASDPS